MLKISLKLKLNFFNRTPNFLREFGRNGNQCKFGGSKAKQIMASQKFKQKIFISQVFIFYPSTYKLT